GSRTAGTRRARAEQRTCSRGELARARGARARYTSIRPSGPAARRSGQDGGRHTRGRGSHVCPSGAGVGDARRSRVRWPGPEVSAEEADPRPREHHQTRITLMRLLAVILLSLSVSLDALLAGVAYGIKEIRVPGHALLLIGGVTILGVAGAMW